MVCIILMVEKYKLFLIDNVNYYLIDTFCYEKNMLNLFRLSRQGIFISKIWF